MNREIQRINPVRLSDPSHYGFAHITVVPAGASLVYIAGQSGEDEYGHHCEGIAELTKGGRQPSREELLELMQWFDQYPAIGK